VSEKPFANQFTTDERGSTPLFWMKNQTEISEKSSSSVFIRG
jgi:hypothetical protein